jgi:hypothetical protein
MTKSITFALLGLVFFCLLFAGGAALSAKLLGGLGVVGYGLGALAGGAVGLVIIRSVNR